ncbi:MAG TPA: hypothetical protein VGO62_02230 [Myxococcota bacterium]|jgi:hypothetical protein
MIDLAAALRSLTFAELVGDVLVGGARMRLQFTDLFGDITIAGGHVLVYGALPKADGTLRLRPQRGVVAALDALREIHVDDAEVDAAYVIHGTDPALLLACVPELRALAGHDTTVDVSDTAISVRCAEKESALIGALALWHRAAFFRT